MWEFQGEHGLGGEEDLNVDPWIMYNEIHFLLDGIFTLRRDDTQRYIFDVFISWYFSLQTPLHCAAGNGKVEIVEILCQNGAKVNEQDVCNPTLSSCFQHEY